MLEMGGAQGVRGKVTEVEPREADRDQIILTSQLLAFSPGKEHV